MALLIVDKTAQFIHNWLGEYAKNSGMNGFVVGVSGGIDSALTSTLCAKTGLPVIAISMPIYQQAGQESLADQHLQWLDSHFDNVTIHSLNLTSVFQSMESQFPADIQDDLSMANARSRLRMLSLYTYASHHRMLVAGTGNKIEDFGVGFYTKYGDGGVDVSPIADLMKSEVYQLAKTLGVIDAIQQAAPTDGLWEDDRTDESQLGASYDELEWAMLYLQEGGGDPALLSPAQLKVIAIYEKFHQQNRHKMQPIPVCHIPDELRR
jgi:NAD+ synthase